MPKRRGSQHTATYLPAVTNDILQNTGTADVWAPPGRDGKMYVYTDSTAVFAVNAEMASRIPAHVTDHSGNTGIDPEIWRILRWKYRYSVRYTITLL